MEAKLGDGQIIRSGPSFAYGTSSKHYFWLVLVASKLECMIALFYTYYKVQNVQLEGLL